ncbi:hypothetical protein [Peribacillus sp. TH14]|uniref:hypothetical protein n=1 Tax=Peribacillus sp. TH14 TaxID=2798481 RepID=UPI0019142C2F|nr:hypothetical protein [Peribacillus sp. TH14]MBK5501924.1 hypothetical protein [Peribacillus sp. TH14]
MRNYVSSTACTNISHWKVGEAMEKPNSLQKIYNPNRPKNNELFRAIQQYLQMKHPDKRMTATRTSQYIVAVSIFSGELRNVESRILYS